MLKCAALVAFSAAIMLPNLAMAQGARHGTRPEARQAMQPGTQQGNWQGTSQGTWQGTWNAYPDSRIWRAPRQSVESPRVGSPRDPTGILRGQGLSSRYGGMGNMGGGSGRSANTGVGLGGIGANQGARF